LISILAILKIIAGLILALFVPGYLLARTFFKELSELEKIALAFVLSISIDIFLGLFLGYNEKMKDITGGITAKNLWIYLSLITLVLLLLYVIIRKEEIKKLFSPHKKDADSSNQGQS